MAALSVAGLTLGACGGLERPDNGAQVPPDIGTSVEMAALSLSLVNAPSDALCLELAVSSTAGMSGGKTQLFDIASGSSSSLTMTGLPSGDANVSARSFGVPCAQVQASTSPTWVSVGPVPVVLVAGQTAATSIVLRRPSTIQVTATFDDGSLTITPAAKDFGGTQVGGMASATFSVLNPGTAVVTLSPPTLTGADANQFQLYQNGCGATLAAGAACPVTVLFKPTLAGAKTATLTVSSGTATLTGTALAAALAITPNPAAFPSTPVGTTASLTVTLTNASTMELAFGGWTITGASDFGLGSTTCGTSLAPTSACAQVITFSPVSGGTKTATLATTSGASATLTGSAPVVPVYRINSGSSSAVSPFTADQYYSGGTQHSVTTSIDLGGVTSPAPQGVYQSERYGNTTYTFPSLVASAQYTVRLHFAELYWTAAGKRVFGVAINGTNVLSSFDIYATAGGNYKAVAREFKVSASSSGQIVVKLTTVTDNASVSGIEITPVCAPSCSGLCGGSDGCGGTCPNTCIAPKVCGGSNQCMCPAGTCGPSCLVCAASTPYCSAAGQCVQCNTVADCAAGYLSCNAGACGCRAAPADNKVLDWAFDGGTSAPWVLSGATFSPSVDADNCPASGAMQFTSSATVYSRFSQCLPMAPGVSFEFGFRYLGAPICTLSYHSLTGCDDASQISWEDGYRNETPTPFWTSSVPKQTSTPPGTASVKISCLPDVIADPTSYDQFYLTPSACTPNCTGKCGGSDGCGGTCPSTCPSSAPICSASGQCVQCNTVADCAAGYLSCNAGACGCRAAPADNKVLNWAFDGGMSAPWTLSGATFSPSVDADNCPASGAMQFTSSAGIYSRFSQCLPMAPGVSFKFGFRYLGAPICTLSYHSLTGCDDASQISWEDGYRNETPTPFWTSSVPKQTSTPPGTASVKISCLPDVVADPTTYDQFYLTPSACTPNCTGKCGGSDGCGGSCPSTCVAPQVCGSNNQCTCPAGTCGASCLTCPSGAPICSATGQCVQCSTAADCPSGHLSCTAGTCGCRLADANNKLLNPGLDKGTYSPWVLGGGASFSSSTDADNCPASGALQFTAASSLYATLSQCLSMGPGVSFRFGFRYLGAPICVLSYHSVAGCNSSYEISREDGYRDESPNSFWTDSPPKLGTTPAGTVSVKVSCNPDMVIDPTTYDQFYFNTGTGAF